ncbi:VOC family protein [Methanosarcina mazei]|uniref:VOC family protein n=1 Tax=Methanosarcina mazei TaxID=2209 RepID=UPI000A6B1DFE|nr:VOC family protein [Methanosarcina mazei]
MGTKDKYHPNYLIRTGGSYHAKSSSFRDTCRRYCKGKKFYEDVFGWEIEKLEGPIEYWSLTTGKQEEPGINGGLMIRQGGEPGAETAISSYICTIDIPDIDKYLNQVQKHGGKVTMEKRSIPGVGWLAYCLDTEKNIFGIMQPDVNAR